MNHFLKADKIIKNLLKKGKKDFTIYPFGEYGMLVKNILNQRYGIQEKYIVDNVLGLSGLNGIITLEEYKMKDHDEITVLLASDSNTKAYSDTRYQLMQYVSINQIVDIFSSSMFFDEDEYYVEEWYEDWKRPHPRYAMLKEIGREIYFNKVEGAIAECGVYKGEFANMISRIFPERYFYLFDTFQGFDDRDIDEQEDCYSKIGREDWKFRDISVEKVLTNIGYRSNAIIRKGYFPDTAVGLEDERFAFVNLDTDLYKPIMAGLEFFWPRLNPGGYIFVHDLRNKAFGGGKKGSNRFF